ncbi:hypothetical protein ACF06X_30140 [Streptomyces sp. NPDC015346]|uniref:hypothetical protein n=1 Tax=Streptomyces sp. NPDC015346 TaxID=3364954 RepID=UPI00370124FB
MNHGIWSALWRTLTRLLTPPAPAAAAPAPPPRTATGRYLFIRRTAPLHAPAPHRAEAPVLDPGGPLVRPYLLAQEQRDRRIAFALALDGIDVGPWVIHGRLVGTGVGVGVGGTV